ncbi:hypothetical protein NPX13_g4130 [Xylaria arbuscula]|uniref:40S ribosomal protein S18 n=1 Tax=Xylaria arbuscula TaxID=114810 RepID=A0A9W8NGZ3_9PEZI|nr:hypothetical protein NPX13_g4130 [Xylaria arbuscula]
MVSLFPGTNARSLVSGEKSNFQFIIRLLNTNVDGKQKALYSLTSIKGIGPRFADLILKKADIDKNKRAGELTAEELERVVQIVKDPAAYKIPAWFLNRQRDIVTGTNSHAISSAVDSKLREDLERLKKIRAHRGLRHYWGLRVRGQHTKTTAAAVVPSVCPRRRDRERQWSWRRTVGLRDGVTSMYPIANHIILDFGVLVFGDMGMLDESRGFRVLKMVLLHPHE